MENIRQSVRPRHQVLTLKCYPKFQRGAVEVKPNSSELSYLLYYASTRRSKLRKVGAFLEKKTENDLWRNKSGNVIVTLQILHALVEKCPRDLPLFSYSILRVLEFVLKGNDVNLVEESVSVWEAFCARYDTTQFSADQEHVAQFRGILNLYASYSSNFAPPKPKDNRSVPVILRYRTAGLSAIKALVSSPSFAVEDGELCDIVVPVILENLYSETPDYLQLLQGRQDEKSRQEKEYASKRRQSATMQRNTLSLELDASVAAGTIEDADQRAEEEAAVIAMQGMRQIFSSESRGQIRQATTCTIKFIRAHDKTTGAQKDLQGANNLKRSGWACEIFEAMCQWTAVQNRFIVLVAAVEALIKSPIVEDDLRDQLKLTQTIRWLLHSSINFIGLSVMDVLVGLLQHILLLLQLGGEGSQLRPHPQQSTTKAIENSLDAAPHAATKSSDPPVMEIVKTPSLTRKNLLVELQHCIGELSTHVYYTDQIEDMVHAILSRLKPSHVTGLDSTASAIQNPVVTAETIADSVSLQEKAHTDGFFSFDTARILALGAVRDVIVVANSSKKEGRDAVDRNAVDVAVWEGTQWLLRDPDVRVRGAYVEALLCWLDLELEKQDLRASTTARRIRNKPRVGGISRRATSNASRQSPSRNVQSSFLQLLHLAIYDGAIEYAESEPDVLMLHLLLYHLIRNLGVNSVRSGLPMIYALQDEMQSSNSFKAKIALGSLVHGYFWALSDCFDFDTSTIGRAIFEEINRRTQSGAWLAQIYVPPLAFDKIPLPTGNSPVQESPKVKYDFKPLGYRRDIVERINDAYSGAVFSAPTSPAASPDRPAIVSSISYISAVSHQANDRLLPNAFKEDMLATWSREDCIAIAQRESIRESVRAQSISGSKPASNRNLPNTNGASNGLVHSRSEANISRAASMSQSQTNLGRLSPRSMRSHTNPRMAFSMVHSNSSTSPSVVRVSHLKQILAGNDFRSSLPRGGTARGRLEGDDDDDDDSTMMSVDFTNESFVDMSSIVGPRNEPGITTQQSVAGHADEVSQIDHAMIANDAVPPVPATPTTTVAADAGPQLASPAMGSDLTTGINKQLAQGVATTSLEGNKLTQTASPPDASSMGGMRYTSGTNSRADLDRLLGGLEISGAAAGKGHESARRIVRPPY